MDGMPLASGVHMVISESKLLPLCRVCAAEVDGARLRKCVGLGASMLFYGLSREQVNPALAAMGEPPLPDRLDLRVWCEDCAGKILRQAADGRGQGDCSLCRRRLREEVEPGCELAGPEHMPRPLCLPCRTHVYVRERRS